MKEIKTYSEYTSIGSDNLCICVWNDTEQLLHLRSPNMVAYSVIFCNEIYNNYTN